MTIKQKAVLIDCDEILLNHLGGFKSYVEKYHNIKTQGIPVQYNLQEWLQCSRERVMELLEEFNFRSYEFGLLEPMDRYVVDRMHYLRAMHPDVAFIIVTKSGTFGHAEVLRKVNLHNVFGDIFDDIIILEQNQSKKSTYMKLAVEYDIVTVIDDYLGNIDHVIELGLDNVVLECPHNVEAKGTGSYNFMKNWCEIAEHITFKIDGCYW